MRGRASEPHGWRSWEWELGVKEAELCAEKSVCCLQSWADPLLLSWIFPGLLSLNPLLSKLF